MFLVYDREKVRLSALARYHAFKKAGLCPKCGRTRDNPKFAWCSSCRTKHYQRKANYKLEAKVSSKITTGLKTFCSQCGKEFVAENASKFCSDGCRNERYRLVQERKYFTLSVKKSLIRAERNVGLCERNLELAREKRDGLVKQLEEFKKTGVITPVVWVSWKKNPLFNESVGGGRLSQHNNYIRFRDRVKAGNKV